MELMAVAWAYWHQFFFIIFAIIFTAIASIMFSKGYKIKS